LKYSTFWQCRDCQNIFPCFRGMPKLYLEDAIGSKDKLLRDYFYNGLLGRFYKSLMPFLTLPARPFNKSKKDWTLYLISVILICVLLYKSMIIVLGMGNFSDPYHSSINGLSILVLFIVAYFFIRHPYFFFLFLLAIPVKISLSLHRYKPQQSFPEIHEEIINNFLSVKKRPLQILDISTGTGNSLYRHGWMKLDAEYTGLDLSEIMLAQCQTFMSTNRIPIELIIGNATTLPFNNEYFDIVLNYGAINGYSDIQMALSEMTRVVKKNGIILFLDEQLYPNASGVEKIYFKKVLSSHNVIHHCPVEFLPANITNVKVHQVYEFYYLCTYNVN